MERKKIRYAIVGQGYFAQSKVLPAFANAGERCELAAIVSGDEEKRRELGARYSVPHVLSYEEFFGDGGFVDGDEIDAVYLVTPNDRHKDETIRCARAGKHVLCEKPMAMTAAECEEMIRACDDAKVKLMIAYRLHFEESNLAAIGLVKSGRLGEPRLFTSMMTYQVKEGTYRTAAVRGGGPLYDMGVYPVNAARYLFRDEPLEVFATQGHRDEARFSDIEAHVAAVLKFPDDRLASFIVSFGAAAVAWYELVGDDGVLHAQNGYEYDTEIEHTVTIGEGKPERHTFPPRDQIAPELDYFADCIREDKTPEPSGVEGLADVRILEAIRQSAETGRAVQLGGFERRYRPEPEQVIRKPEGGKPEDLVKASRPH